MEVSALDGILGAGATSASGLENDADVAITDLGFRTGIDFGRGGGSAVSGLESAASRPSSGFEKETGSSVAVTGFGICIDGDNGGETPVIGLGNGVGKTASGLENDAGSFFSDFDSGGDADCFDAVSFFVFDSFVSFDLYVVDLAFFDAIRDLFNLLRLLSRERLLALLGADFVFFKVVETSDSFLKATVDAGKSGFFFSAMAWDVNSAGELDSSCREMFLGGGGKVVGENSSESCGSILTPGGHEGVIFSRPFSSHIGFAAGFIELPVSIVLLLATIVVFSI